MKPPFAVALTGLAVLALSPAFAQTPDPVQLTSSSPAADQDFGFSVDVNREVVVVGAFRDDDGLQLERGSAYVYRFDGADWQEEQLLLGTVTNAFNWFGWDVAVSGDVILVSERNGDALLSNAGNVDVFRYADGSWDLETTLTPPSGQAGEDFGYAVDVDGSVAAVGAPNKDGAVADEGAVYVFRFNGAEWLEDGELRASDPALQDLFGSAVAIDGDRMLVGAFNAADSTSNQAGKVYVFEYDGATWNETAILQSNASNNLANMGVSVALDGDWAVSGAPGDNELAFGAGAAIVHHFDGAGWNFHSKLTGSDGQGFFLFGSGAAVQGNIIVVGAENWAAPGENATGKAFVFEHDEQVDEWNEIDGVLPDGGSGGEEFGQSVAFDQDVAVVGAPDWGGPGAAFVYGEPREATAASEELPTSTFQVSTPFPNPFTNATRFVLTSDTNQDVVVTLYDVLGRPARTLFDGRIGSSSAKTVEIEAGDAPSGVYWIRVASDQRVVSRSVSLVR